MVKFENLNTTHQTIMTIPELVGLAQAGRKISVDLALSYLPAVEHFANQKNAQTYLSGELTAKADAKTYRCHRCFACYPTDQNGEARSRAISVANARLELMFGEFERAGIAHRKQYFRS